MELSRELWGCLQLCLPVRGIFFCENYQGIDFFGFMAQSWRLGTYLGTHRENGAHGCDLHGLGAAGDLLGASRVLPEPLKLRVTRHPPPPLAPEFLDISSGSACKNQKGP